MKFVVNGSRVLRATPKGLPPFKDKDLNTDESYLTHITKYCGNQIEIVTRLLVAFKVSLDRAHQNLKLCLTLEYFFFNL